MIGRTTSLAARRATTTVSSLSSSLVHHPSPSLAAQQPRRPLVSVSTAASYPHPRHGNNEPTKRLDALNFCRPRAVLSQPPKQHAFVMPTTSSSFSTTAKSDDENEGSGGIRGWMNDRQARKEQEKYMEQMTRLSTMETFTMEKYKEELKSGIDGSGMMAKVSFLQPKEMKQAQEVVDVVDKIIDVVGKDATAEDLIKLDRLQRLRVATAANKTLEEIAIMVSQITNMDVMQKTLRKRYLEGKPIPSDRESMQAVIQKDAMSVLSNSQKELMKNRQESHARRQARKRRR